MLTFDYLWGKNQLLNLVVYPRAGFLSFFFLVIMTEKHQYPLHISVK